MTTELEQEFFSTFGIEKQCICTYYPEYKERGCKICIKYFQGDKNCNKKRYKYPDITAEKLLEMICIWNYIMPCIDDCIIPIDYLGLKSVILDKMIRYSEIEYEFDVDALKYQIKQLFNET